MFQIRFLKYTLPLFIFAAAYLAFSEDGIFTWLPVLIGFFLIPILELFIQPNAQNLDAAEEAIAKADAKYDVLLYIIVPLQYAAVWFCLQSLSGNTLQHGWEIAGRIVSLGMLCGTFGINVGHELGHRNTWYEQAMAKALLLTSLYTHFFIEHNKGHHKHVSTPNDPSSAPYGYTLYRFWIRTIKGTYLKAWQIAADDAAKAGKARYGWYNEMLQLQLLQLLWVAGIYFLFGGLVTLYYIAAAVVGFLLLETVNYVEHYGLSRKQTATGSFERTMPHHSWNSNHVIGRLILFELSRHSDHHYLASRKYQVLRHHDSAPQLPTGYPGSMLLATIPPLWFKIMHRKIKQLSQTNATAVEV
ncbi:MAG: alkane 1-monooxygenase [Chitinophagaceae bacterium]